MAKMPPIRFEAIGSVEKRRVRRAGKQRVPQHPIFGQLFDVVDFDNFNHKAGDPNRLSETRKEQWRVKSIIASGVPGPYWPRNQAISAAPRIFLMPPCDMSRKSNTTRGTILADRGW